VHIEVKDSRYKGHANIDMQCWRESQGMNNVLGSVGGDGTTADMGLVSDLQGVII
jgi:hypothetical protein